MTPIDPPTQRPFALLRGLTFYSLLILGPWAVIAAVVAWCLR